MKRPTKIEMKYQKKNEEDQEKIDWDDVPNPIVYDYGEFCFWYLFLMMLDVFCLQIKLASTMLLDYTQIQIILSPLEASTKQDRHRGRRLNTRQL